MKAAMAMNGLRIESEPPSAVDLFSGCGGLTLGLKQAGFNVVCAIEVDAAAVRTYQRNHPEVAVSHTDIRKLDADDLRRSLKMDRGELDLLAGCPPCQGFSTLRTRNGTISPQDSRNDLLLDMLRFVEAFSPKSIMMENVPRLREHFFFTKFCSRLCDLGYMIKHEIKDAADYAVPQRRKRLILLAGKNMLINFATKSKIKPTVRSAISDLSRPGLRRDRLHNLPETRSARVAQIIRDVPRDGGSRLDLPPHRQLKCHKNTSGFRDIYGRMTWDSVAPTITGGCFNPSKGRFLHPDQDRNITMREAAILQSFPRSYRFDPEDGKQAIALMIGNALPPEFIRRHALQVRRMLNAYQR